MRKVHSFLTILILLLHAAACQKVSTEPVEPGKPGEGWTTVHLRAVVSGDAGTKATLDERDRNYIFERDDILYVVEKGGTGDELYGILYLTAGAGKTEAVFDGDVMYFDPVSPHEPGEPGDSFEISASLFSGSQRDNNIVKVANGKITEENLYTLNSVAPTFKEAVRKYSKFTGDATYGNPSFHLEQQSTFVIFSYAFEEDPTSDVTFTLTNNGDTAPLRTITVAPVGNQAGFAAAFEKGTTLNNASVTVSGTGIPGGLTPRSLADGALRANYYYSVSQSYVDLEDFVIQASDATDITFNYTNAGLRYSRNGTEWTDVSAQASVSLNAGEKIKVQGTGSQYSGSGTLFTSTGNCYIYGDIMSLFRESGYTTKKTALGNNALKAAFINMTNIDILPGRPLVLSATTVGESCYQEMFSGCTSLRNPPVFIDPTDRSKFAATLGKDACNNMFSGCTALLQAPNLPATTVKKQGYFRMFYGCTSLEMPPVRLATTLEGENVCKEMFSGCTALMYAPELPATSIPNSGYYNMFYGCTSLLATPAELPFTTVGADACHSMFKGCSSLATGPSQLAAIEMKSSCYQEMFYRCSSLVEAPEILAETLANNCFQDMFYGCSLLRRINQEEFHFKSIPQSACQKMFAECPVLLNAPNMMYVEEVGKQGCEQMYYNCGEMATAPAALTATTVGEKGYRQMFYSCARISAAPSIDATNIGNNGCEQMFYKCIRLQTPPPGGLPATTLSPYAYNQMFYECTALETPPTEMKATTVAEKACQQMFYRCTSLKETPVFTEATGNLSSTRNFYQMFAECKNLVEAKGQLYSADTQLTNECFREMFKNCTALREVPSGFLPSTHLAELCYCATFENCSSLTAAPVLPAPELVSKCYEWLFNKCSSLSSITCLATSGIVVGNMTKWIANGNSDNFGLAASGTFTRPASAADAWTAIGTLGSGLPTGWTIQNAQ
ncbi:MAG: leucine-rich repeat protein [Bacteroidales bacterium]|nr:leucine-rich repeat protein [Bacteroidales bacterium]